MAFRLTDTHIAQLRRQVAGSVLTPDDAAYEQTRLTWNRSTNHYPALILVPRHADDVAAGIHFAREAGLGVAVQSTGHGTQYPADDNLLIVTSQMDSVQVDPEACIAQVEAGVIWQQVLDKTTPHGLAPLLGSSPHVGVIGYTLGGGIGWLARRYGLAADSVRWIDIVTADGVLKRASSAENSDLFWGLRGGGGNFGVVTAMAFDLYPVETVYGGSLIYSGAVARDALRFYREWIETVPDELTSSITVLKIPSLPQVPEAMRGTIQVIVRAAFVGPATEGAAWMQPWLDWHSPVSNQLHEMPFAEIDTISNDPTQPTAGLGSNEMVDKLSDELIDVIIQYVTNPASPLTFTELRHAGGAIARVPVDFNAISNRDARLYLQMAGLVPTAEAYAAVKAYIRGYREALRPYVQGGVYLNFTKGSEEDHRAKDAFSTANYARLLNLKARYDPENLFRFSYRLTQPEKTNAGLKSN
ncbi:MAG: FAD-binding oxidoreductase [Anaerolineae bacterium]|nr:FAD-binding oxidoreductase [Anaerolineae bacterium]